MDKFSFTSKSDDAVFRNYIPKWLYTTFGIIFSVFTVWFVIGAILTLKAFISDEEGSKTLYIIFGIALPLALFSIGVAVFIILGLQLKRKATMSEQQKQAFEQKRNARREAKDRAIEERRRAKQERELRKYEIECARTVARQAKAEEKRKKEEAVSQDIAISNKTIGISQPTLVKGEQSKAESNNEESANSGDIANDFRQSHDDPADEERMNIDAKRNEDIIKMQDELGIYNIPQEEADEYLKLKNAYHLKKICEYLRFFVVLAVIGIVAGILVGVFAI